MVLVTAALTAGRLDEAILHFRRALAEDSLNVSALSGLGVALARGGHFDAAAAPLAEVVTLKPTVPQYRHDLVLLDMKRGLWQSAAAELEVVLTLAPGEIGSWRALADCERRLGHPDSSVLALRAAREHNPANAALHAALADAYALWVASAGQQGDPVAFARAWTGFSTEFPDDPRVAEW